MRSKKEMADLDWQTSSVMRWSSGEEVEAYLDWDERRYYLWFEPTSGFEDWCEEVLQKEHDDSMVKILAELREELAQIGVQEFCDLDGVNEFCKWYCGDDEPAYFYEDDLTGICGA